MIEVVLEVDVLAVLDFHTDETSRTRRVHQGLLLVGRSDERGVSFLLEFLFFNDIRHSFVYNLLAFSQFFMIFVLIYRHKSDIYPSFIRHNSGLIAFIPTDSFDNCHSQIHT